MMQMKLDKVANALYIRLRTGKVHKTIARGSGLIDLDKKGEIIGIEVLGYSKKGSNKATRPSILVGGKKYLLPA